MKCVILLLGIVILGGCVSYVEPEKDATAMSDDREKMSAKGGWAQSGKLFTGNANKKVSVQADLPKAGYYTVQFGVNPPPNVPTSKGVFDAIAEISWSVNGNTVRRQVSVGSGVSISGVGQSVKVTVRDTTQCVALGVTPGFEYVVTINVAPGTRPSQQEPALLKDIVLQRLQAAATLGPAVPIPQDSGVISMELAISPVPNGAPVVARLIFLDGVPNIYKTIALPFQGFIPVPPNATQVTIDNTGGTFNNTITWGIDG